MAVIRKFNPVFLLFAATTLVACGGSSGTGGPAAAPPPPIDPLTSITATNALPVAAAVTTAVFTIDNLAVLADAVVAGGGAIVNAKSVGSVAAVDTVTAQCEVSGSVVRTITSDDIPGIDAGVLAPGDELSLTFSSCDDIGGVDSVVTDGVFGLVVKTFSGNVLTGLYRLEADLTITDLAVTAANETITLNADMGMILDLLDATVVKITVSGGRVDEQRSTNGGTTTDSFTTMTQFEINTTTTQLGADIAFTTGGNGVLMSSDFTGEVNFDIDPPFQNLNIDNPSAGTLVITGSGPGSITLENFDDVSAKLDVQPSDGGTGEPQFATWDELF